jgi:hypothetical protein
LKKLSPRFKRWLLHRARFEARKRSAKANALAIQIWQGNEKFFASSRKPLLPPENFSFSENFEQTCRVLEHIRRRFLNAGGAKARWLTPAKHSHKLPRLPAYWDFSAIEKITTSAALVFAAEYARMAELMNSPPPIIEVKKWQPDVLAKLAAVGFFDIVRFPAGQIGERFEQREDQLTLKIIDGVKENTAEADKALIRLGEFLDPGNEIPLSISVPVVTALSEAMINVHEHAYPSDHVFRYPPVKRWWVTGTADRNDMSLAIAIYDQGATIPLTYTKVPPTEQILNFLKLSAEDDHVFARDGALIAAANRFGNSQRSSASRGKGLPQMRDAIDAAGNGSLTVWSRGGQYLYEAGKGEKHHSFQSSIGGTLIEWRIQLR